MSKKPKYNQKLEELASQLDLVDDTSKNLESNEPPSVKKDPVYDRHAVDIRKNKKTGKYEMITFEYDSESKDVKFVNVQEIHSNVHVAIKQVSDYFATNLMTGKK